MKKGIYMNSGLSSMVKIFLKRQSEGMSAVNASVFILKKSKLACLLLAFLLSGCSTGNARFMPKGASGLPSAISRFEQAKGISCSELPVLYDVSRLKAGSSVKLQLNYDNSKKPSFETMSLREIRPANREKKYIIDIVSGFTHYSLEGDTSSFNRVICSDGASIKGYFIKRDRSAWALVKSAGGGVLGIAAELIERAREPAEGREFKGMEDTETETKIIDFKFVFQDILTIAGRSVPCKVYIMQTVAREMISPKENSPRATSIIEERKRVWISDEVPFGLVRSEGKKIVNMEVPGMGFINIGQDISENCEVVEFNY